jgi:outer membrane immunogenic protein
MIYKVIIIGVTTAALMLSNSVYAGNAGSRYGGIQYAITTYSEDGVSEEPKPTALIGLVGANITDRFAVEGRLGFGLQDDTVSVSGADVSTDIDSLIGVYGIGHINLGGGSSVYGLLGVSRAELTFSYPDNPVLESKSDNKTGLSFGIGADIPVSNYVALNIEFVQYLMSGFDLSAFSFGVKFGI